MPYLALEVTLCLKLRTKNRGQSILPVERSLPFFACVVGEFSGMPHVQARSLGPLGEEGGTVLMGSSRAGPFDHVSQGLLEVGLPDLRPGVLA